MLMKFFRDLDIFILSMLRCPVRMLERLQELMHAIEPASPEPSGVRHILDSIPQQQGESYKQRTCMEEVVDPLRLALALCVFFMEERLCLCQLILVVRECQVNAPCVYVYARVKQAAGHRRALNMPSCTQCPASITRIGRRKPWCMKTSKASTMALLPVPTTSK
jgi:hypothetical protein